MKIFTTKTELSLQDIATICLRHDTAKGRELRLKRWPIPRLMDTINEW